MARPHQLTNRQRHDRDENLGRFGWIIVSFLARERIGRERVPVVIAPWKKENLKIQTRPLVSPGAPGVSWAPWTKAQHMRALAKKKNHFPPPINFKLWKVELRALESTTTEKIANELKKMFQDSDRLLLGLRCELSGDVKTWSSRELFYSQEYLGLMKTQKTLDSMKNNGSTGSQIRFFEKMALLYRIELASNLNVHVEKVDEIFQSVRSELRHFN